MKRNTIFAVAALLLVVLGSVGLFVGYKGYKKYQAKQRQEFRIGGSMGKARIGFDREEFKKFVLTDEALSQVIEEHDLLSVWDLDAAAAEARLREKFIVDLDGQDVKISYQDKKKEVAKSVLQSIVKSYYQKLKVQDDARAEPDATPDAAPDTAPDATPDAAPETPSP